MENESLRSEECHRNEFDVNSGTSRWSLYRYIFFSHIKERVQAQNLPRQDFEKISKLFSVIRNVTVMPQT